MDIPVDIYDHRRCEKTFSDLAEIINASEKVSCLVLGAFRKDLEESSEEKRSNGVRKSDKIMKKKLV